MLIFLSASYNIRQVIAVSCTAAIRVVDEILLTTHEFVKRRLPIDTNKLRAVGRKKIRTSEGI
jgi:hypothetical protein